MVCVCVCVCVVQRSICDIQWRYGVREVGTDADVNCHPWHQYDSARDGTSCHRLCNHLLYTVEQRSVLCFIVMVYIVDSASIFC